MNSRIASALLVGLLAASSGAHLAYAETFVGGTTTWTLVASPVVQKVGTFPAAAVTFENHLNMPVLGIVIFVIHNHLGQTVYFSTSTINITHGSFGTAYLVEFGLAGGLYNASIFAVSTAGVAVSDLTTFAFEVD